jgi:hypothetical protein
MVNIEPSEFITADWAKFDKINGQYYVKTTVKDPINLVSSSSTFSDYKTNDLDTAGTTQYVGQAIPNTDSWLITKIVTTVDDYALTYANISNNATKTTYALAWTDRATLTYAQIKDLTFSNQSGSTPTSSNPLPVTVYGTDGVSSSIDPVTQSVMTVDYPHHEIHSGGHYEYYDSVEVDNGSSQRYLITTPNTAKWSHVSFEVDGSAITRFALYEDSDRTGTTLQTSFNNNRNSLNVAGMTIHKGTSGGTTDGTLIAQYKSGSANGAARTGASSENNNEFILKQNTKYVLIVESFTNDNLINVRLGWYEHTNKQ